MEDATKDMNEAVTNLKNAQEELETKQNELNAKQEELDAKQNELNAKQEELDAKQKELNEAKKQQVNVKKVTQKKPASKKKKQLQISWKAETGASGYEVQYALKKNMKNAVTKTVSAGKTKLTVKKLKSKKKYFIRVRAYKKVGSMTVYGAYSKVNSVKVR